MAEKNSLGIKQQSFIHGRPLIPRATDKKSTSNTAFDRRQKSFGHRQGIQKIICQM
jgi:hypothetical protein